MHSKNTVPNIRHKKTERKKKEKNLTGVEVTGTEVRRDYLLLIRCTTTKKEHPRFLHSFRLLFSSAFVGWMSNFFTRVNW